MSGFVRLTVAALLLGASTAAAAANITYAGLRTVQTGSAALSITTDGSVGDISQHILGWTIVLNGEGSTYALKGGIDGGTSSLLTRGSGLTATLTDISFDFDAGGFALFQERYSWPHQFYCLQSSGCYRDGSITGEAVYALSAAAPGLAIEEHGTRVIASVADTGAAVPEPMTWATMLIGLGLTGVSMRLRRPKNIFA